MVGEDGEFRTPTVLDRAQLGLCSPHWFQEARPYRGVFTKLPRISLPVYSDMRTVLVHQHSGKPRTYRWRLERTRSSVKREHTDHPAWVAYPRELL